MHSRIFQVSLNPIEKADYITESNYDYEHWFVGSIADYVSDDCDREEDIKWLKGCVEGISFGADNNGEYFIVESKETYFEKKFIAFKKVLDKISKCTLSDFVQDIFEFYQLNILYEDKYGFYIDTDEELMTFDAFIRYCVEKEKYYLGGTCDYHC